MHVRRVFFRCVLSCALLAPGLHGQDADSSRPLTGGAEAHDPAQPVDVVSFVGGPDVTFCELYGLQQFGRLGSVVGLALATTSWNTGTADLPWFGAPDARHPFIVQNVYRLKDDRFEQIGQSWIKHGFFALDDEQCATPCTYEPGHSRGNWLGVGCTDTYSSFLNANQTGLGPREEVNPWTASWTAAGSHNTSGHAHDPIEHRLQVHDDDFNPAMNSGALYYAEGYYVHFQDTDVMNSAAWKPFTVAGSPGGTWFISMSNFSVSPTIGFAMDAWPGATKTLIAQEIPVVEFSSPDGRAVLGSKSTDLGGGMWHYDYALLNIDMDRKIGSFTVPIDPEKTPLNIGFHSVLSHGESYSNDPWTVEVSTSCPVGNACIIWSTVNNPIRWGTLYNFRFDIDSLPDTNPDPAGATIAVGLFEPGTPDTLTAAAVGPQTFTTIPPPPTAAPADEAGSDVVKPRYISFTVPQGSEGLPTALRVRLTSMHHPTGVIVLPPPDLSAFENTFRYVNTYDGALDCTDSPNQGTAYRCAKLGCQPEYRDWSGQLGGQVLHVTADAVVPDSIYDVSHISNTCGAAPDADTCAFASADLSVSTGRWGDVTGSSQSPPDNATNVLDIGMVVDKIKDLPTAYSKPRIWLKNKHPNPIADLINVIDLSFDVDAVRSQTYPDLLLPDACP